MIIIAELGTNWHPGSGEGGEDIVIENVVGAAKYADIVKIQLFTADKLYSKARAPQQYARVRPYAFPRELLPQVSEAVVETGKKLWASVFDDEAVDLAGEYCTGIKIASGDLTNKSLLNRAACVCSEMSIPLTVSTGASTTDEILDAVDTVSQHSGIPYVVLMNCVSAYPADPKDYYLEPLFRFKEYPGIYMGLSDHTTCNWLSILALGMGHTFFEKHYKPHHTWYPDSKFDPPPDWHTSMSPGSFNLWAQALRDAEHVYHRVNDHNRYSVESEKGERIWARRGPDGLRPAITESE